MLAPQEPKQTPWLGLADITTFVADVDHSEGICLAPDGHLYLGGEAGQLYRIEHTGTVTEVASTGGFLLGVAADASNRIYACDQVKRRVWRIDPTSRETTTFTIGTEQAPMRTPNWGAFGP